MLWSPYFLAPSACMSGSSWSTVPPSMTLSMCPILLQFSMAEPLTNFLPNIRNGTCVPSGTYVKWIILQVLWKAVSQTHANLWHCHSTVSQKFKSFPSPLAAFIPIIWFSFSLLCSCTCSLLFCMVCSLHASLGSAKRRCFSMWWIVLLVSDKRQSKHTWKINTWTTKAYV